ncbi:tyrosine-type recombinase/integrase [Microcoleus sp. FACHB-SPT15]|nr:tyrosine-type recombinase/integrase [Microcoleus sp. FACHB-SPT15]
MEKLIDAAKSVGRYKLRDSVLIFMMFLHGLRVNEAVARRWANIDGQTARIHINRLKRGSPSVQPVDGKEMRLLRQLERTQGEERAPWLFVSERKSPLTDHSILIFYYL